MSTSLSGRIRAKAALIDPNSYGRSDRSAAGRWFWEIDRLLLLLVSVLIGIGLIAVAAASPGRPSAIRADRCSSAACIISTGRSRGSRLACR
jgi:hypothetical protein